jgi:multiple antibiotic resistance protein
MPCRFFQQGIRSKRPQGAAMVQDIILAFIPIFFAVDPIGLLPVFVAYTSHLSPEDKNKIVVQSLITASCLAVGFLFFGKMIFYFLGITIGDFMIAGGAILFCLSMIDLINVGKKQNKQIMDLGVVPIGTPLIVGPAVLTISIMMSDMHGIYATLIAVLVNIVLVGIIFSSSHLIMKLIGEAGARALSKFMALLLAAIGVMMIRKGVITILQQFQSSG